MPRRVRLLYSAHPSLIVFSFTAGEITTRLSIGPCCVGTAALRGMSSRTAGVVPLRVRVRRHRRGGGRHRGRGDPGARRRLTRAAAFFLGMMSAPMVMPEVVVGLSLVPLFTHPALAILGGRGWRWRSGWRTRRQCTAYVAVLAASRLREMDRAPRRRRSTSAVPACWCSFRDHCAGIAPARAQAVLLAFTLSMDDFALAAMLSDLGSTTLSVLVFARSHHGPPEINAPLTVIVVVVSIGVARQPVLLLMLPRAAAQPSSGARRLSRFRPSR